MRPLTRQRGGRRDLFPAAPAPLAAVALVTAVFLVLVLVAGCAGRSAGEPATRLSAPATAAPVPAPVPDPTSGRATTGGPRGGTTGQADGHRGRPAQAPDPVRVRVPAIGVSSRVIPLRLDAGGRLVAPQRFDLAGWNRAGPEPGESGVAVIAGHVDSRTGPAVFYALRRLQPGDRVHVDRADGTTATFIVRRVARYPKRTIPDRQVYGHTPDPQLRLVTCGGAFDYARRSYRDNVVVYATLA